MYEEPTFVEERRGPSDLTGFCCISDPATADPVPSATIDSSYRQPWSGNKLAVLLSQHYPPIELVEA